MEAILSLGPIALSAEEKECYHTEVKRVNSITIDELSDMAKRMYGSLVKAVVDIKKRSLVVDAELHVDEEQYLLESGSNLDSASRIDLLINALPYAKGFQDLAL